MDPFLVVTLQTPKLYFMPTLWADFEKFSCRIENDFEIGAKFPQSCLFLYSYQVFAKPQSEGFAKYIVYFEPDFQPVSQNNVVEYVSSRITFYVFIIMLKYLGVPCFKPNSNLQASKQVGPIFVVFLGIQFGRKNCNAFH